jgi:NTE family protein
MKNIFAFLLSSLLVAALQGQSTDDNRPKIGLVLSGGAAKGIAHVGVLKTLEQAGIRPDIITGTSMGSIIGGLYALGYPADTLEQLVLTQNWDDVLSDRIPLDEVIFEEKPFFENALIEFPFKGWLPQPPSGLIYGQQISKLLSRLTLPYYDVSEFAALPIPFVCIGADIFAGKAIALQEGHLAEAMRASMAIPTVFTPIRKDSFLFVDGGLIHNFPVKEAIDMGADIIIGVYTGRKLADKEEVESFPSILAQAVFLLGIQHAEAQKKWVDIYIEPDLAGYGPEDFSDADTILQRGYEAGQRYLTQLRQLADSVYALRAPPPAIDYPTEHRYWVDSIAIVGNRLIPTYQITGRLNLSTPAPLSADDIEAALDHLYGTNFFERVHYQLEKRGAKNVLVFTCEEKRATTLRFALNYDSYLKAGLLFNLTFRNSLFPSSRFMFFGKLAENYRFGIHYLKYLDTRQELFVTAGLRFNRDVIPIIEDGIRSEEYRTLDFIANLKLHRRIGNNAQLGFDLEREQLSFRPLAGAMPSFSRLNYTNFNISAFYDLNTFDRNIFPTKGIQLQVKATRLNNRRFNVRDLNPDLQFDADSLFNFNPYYTIRLSSQSFIPIGECGAIRIAPFLGLVIDPSNRFGDFFLVGAPEQLTRRSIPFAGLDPNELIAEVAVGGNLGYQHFIHEKWIVAGDVSAGLFTTPSGLENNTLPSQSVIMGANLTIGYNSFIGPVRWSLMYPVKTEGGISPRLRSYISVGHRF